MQKFHHILLGISVLPALLIMPAMADERLVISGNPNAQETDLSLSNVASTSNGGALLVENLSVLTLNGDSSFTNNSSSGGYGGAIFINNNDGGSNPSLNEIHFIGDATFTGNNVNGGGGALYSEGVVVFGGDAIFTNNTTSGGSGAAIGANGLSDVTFNGTATFTGNGVGTTTTGGAISNSGRMVFNDAASFSGNVANTNGAAINNGGTMIFKQGISLTDNIGGSNSGAVSNGGDFIAYGGDIIVTGNQAYKGSGLFLGLGSKTWLGMDENGEIVPVDNITFSNNLATGVNAAALAVQDGANTVEMHATNITFDNNDSATKYGGAIFNASELKILGDTNTFSNNDLHDSTGGKTGGGAIHNRGVLKNGKIADLTIGTTTSTNVFDSNTSESFGGAIAARAVDGEGQDSVVNINGTTTFSNNSADMNGGAIWNQVAESGGTVGLANFTITGNSLFMNNSAGQLGGAIYNSGATTLNGDATFGGIDNTDPLNPVSLGNTAVQGGAIYNTGTTTLNGVATFTNNSAADSGGAIENYYGDLTFNDVATFINNSVTGTGQGGALHNFSATTTFNNGVTFSGNTATSYGAAIYNALNHQRAGIVNINGDSLFENNTSVGGIVFNIYNGTVDNTIAFANGDATFSNNTGIALWNQDLVTFTGMGTVLFDGNTNTAPASSAAISNGGTMTIGTENFIVQNNTSSKGAVGNTSPGSVFTVNATDSILFDNNAGGAIYKENDMLTLNAANSIEFTNNSGSVAGPALNNNGNYSKTVLNAGAIEFSNNTSTTSYGGAIFNSGDYVKILGETNTFTGNRAEATTNTVKFGGGAISNRGNSGATQPTAILIGLEDGSSVNTFNGNFSGAHGGAIHARAEEATDSGVVTINGQTEFSQNRATLNGGAISNSPVSGSSVLTLDGAGSFSNNIAGENGGAIYNTGVTTINATSGNFAFSGNKSAYVDETDFTANDIYNTNVVNLNAASAKSITFGSGISGSNGTMNINSGDASYTGAVVFNANVSGNDVNIARGTLTNNAELDGNLNVNGGTVTSSGTDSVITGSVSIAQGASLETAADKVATVGASTITNAGTLTLTSGELAKDVTGNGTLSVTGAVTNSASIANSVSVANGGNLTTAAGTIATGDGATIANVGTLTLTGGELAKNVSGNGTLSVTGAVTNSASIANSVSVETGGSLTTAAGTIATGSGTTITNAGDLTLTTGTLAKAVTGTGNMFVTGNVSSNASYLGNNVNNSGTLTLTTGTLSRDVSGTGTLAVTGSVTNSASIANSVSVANGGNLTTAANTIATGSGTTIANAGTLTLTTGTLAKAVNGTGNIRVTGNVSSDASYLGNNVNNSGTLTLTTGTLAKSVTGTGNILVTGAVRSNASYLGNNVNNSGTLTLTSGTLNKNVTGTGDLVVDGSVTNASGRIGNNVTINANKSLTSAASLLEGSVENNGNLTLNTGTLEHDLTGSGTLNINDGNTLTVGLRNITQDTINLNGRMTAELDSSVAGPRFTANTFSGHGTLHLTMREAGTYNVFGADVFDPRLIEFEEYPAIGIDSPVYNLVWDNNGNVTAVQKSVEEIAESNDISDDAALMVSNFMNSSSSRLNDLGLTAQNRLAANDSESVTRAGAAINPERTAVVQALGVSLQNALADLTSNRLTMRIAKDDYGDVNRNAMWVQGLYNHVKQDDVFSGYTRGVAVGFDGTIQNTWTFGAGYVYAKSDVVATERDIDVDSLAVVLYAQYKPHAWYVNAFADYAMSNYTETGMALGTKLTAEYDVKAFAGQVSTGYNFDGGFAPELGLRYTHLTTSEYKNSLDMSMVIGDRDFLTAILGAKYGYGFEVSKNLILRPEVGYAVKYDLISDDMSGAVMVPGVDTYTVTGEGLSRIGTEVSAGFGVRYKGLDVSLNYNIEAREGYTSQTGRAKFRVEF